MPETIPPKRLVLFTGPAGAGKSTLASAWCRTREQSVLIELDSIRDLIQAGRADPQVPNELQAQQYGLSVEACIALARTFLSAGYDVAITDAVDADAYEHYWRPPLGTLPHDIAVILPTVAETLLRSRSREKRVMEVHTRNQHAAAQHWPAQRRIDTTGLTVDQSLALVLERLDR